jgi:hypothetical protein
MMTGDHVLTRRFIVTMPYIVLLLIGTLRFLKKWERLSREVSTHSSSSLLTRAAPSSRMMKGCYKSLSDARSLEL